MQDKYKYKEDYQKNWFMIANVIGVFSAVAITVVCIYEYHVLLNVYKSKSLAFSGSISIELGLWFFAKMAVKDLIFRQQQRQFAKLAAHMKKFTAPPINRSQKEIDVEFERFQTDERLVLTRIERIPDNGLPQFAMIFLYFIFLGLSIFIITQNRGESKKIDTEQQIKIAQHAIDSLANIDIELEENNVDAAINRIVANGVINDDKLAEISNKLAELSDKIKSLDVKSVNQRAQLEAEKKALKKSIKTLPISKQAEIEKADVESNFTALKKTKNGEIKKLKNDKAVEIRASAQKDNQQVNFYAIFTNAFYIVFQYIIVFMRTITDKRSFDLVEYILDTLLWIFKGIKKRLVKIADDPIVRDTESVVEEENSADIAPNVAHQEPEPEVATQQPVETEKKNGSEEVKIIQIPNTVYTDVENQKKELQELIKKRKEATKPVKQHAAAEFYRQEIVYDPFYKSDLKRMIETFEIDVLGMDAATVFNAIQMGRRTVIEGVTISKSIIKMNNILAILEKHNIVVDPSDTMRTSTPKMKKKKILINNQKVA